MKFLLPLLPFLFAKVQADFQTKGLTMRFRRFRNEDLALANILAEKKKAFENNNIEIAQFFEEQYDFLKEIKSGDYC